MKQVYLEMRSFIKKKIYIPLYNFICLTNNYYHLIMKIALIIRLQKLKGRIILLNDKGLLINFIFFHFNVVIFNDSNYCDVFANVDD